MITTVFALFAFTCLLGAVSSLTENEGFRKLLIVLLAVILVLVAGFRAIGIDQDSVGYLNYYNLDDGRMSLAAEPTFVFIANVTRGLFQADGIRWLFVAYAILGVTIKLIAIRRLTSLFWLSVITYLSGYYLLHELTQIRAGVAAGLVLLSIDFICRRKPVHFVAAVAAASLFHYSALIAFPLYFLGLDLSRRSRIAIALAIPAAIAVRTVGLDILYVIPIQLVESKIDTYTQLRSFQAALNVYNAVYLIKYALLYVFLYFNRPIAEQSRAFPILIKMYALSMFTYIALSYNSAFAMRISELFGIVEILLIPMLVYALRSQLIAVLAVVGLAAGNLVLGIYQTELIHQDGWRGG
jgi:hypothetical protein